ncbi:hypothetical protein LTS15_009659 [Exophiala xenobiotica]|nr:hypothetical protein LTS15_009659 [Exophiala xenobiotica]
MDMLHSGTYPQEQESVLGLDPLSISSGNIQSSIIKPGEGIENQRSRSSAEWKDELTTRPSVHQLPLPTAPLFSNDIPTHPFDQKPQIQDQLHPFKRRRHAPGHVRPFEYLKNEKYQSYRRRPRQDFGRDDKPIWPLYIEDAFQEAIQCIKPMGRKKWSQGGRLNGRNMLISEYIWHRTGERRTRKQVSSHIQVLDRFLRFEPEWVRLTKVPGDQKSGSQSQAKGHKFHHHSLEQMDTIPHKMMGGYNQLPQHHQGFIKEEAWDDNEDDTFSDSSVPVFFLASYFVQQMHFEARVLPPPNDSNQNRTLHQYTQLSSRKTRPKGLPLETLHNWRESFPRLHATMDELCTSNPCEIILLNSAFHLMDDFPPKHSKLGITLDLDFQCHDWPEMQHDREAKRWTVATHIYQNGVLLVPPSHEECYGSTEGLVKPFFQSAWWASTLTALTDEKKMAKDSKDAAATKLANDRSREFFAGLTIMQEIFALRYMMGENLNTKKQKPRRAAILLWKFTQASSPSTASTTWQPLMLPEPVGEPSGNSPKMSASAMELPPLPMDTMVDYVDSVEEDSASHFQQEFTFGMLPIAMDHELCQDEYMAFDYPHKTRADQTESSFHIPMSHEYMANNNFSPAQGIFGFSHTDYHPMTASHAVESGNIFELPQLSGQDGASHSLEYTNQGSLDTDCCSTGQVLQTHQALQDHLGPDESLKTASSQSSITKPEADTQSQNLEIQHWHRLSQEDIQVLQFLAADDQQRKRKRSMDKPWPQLAEDEEALKVALLAASGDSDHRLQTHGEFAHCLPPAQERHEAEHHWLSPLAIRPPLQTHHSFHVLSRTASGFGASHIDNTFQHTHAMPHEASCADTYIEGQDEHPFSANFLSGNTELDGNFGSRGLARAHSESDLYVHIGGFSLPETVPPLPTFTVGADESTPGLHALAGDGNDSETSVVVLPGDLNIPVRSQPQPVEENGLGSSFVDVFGDEGRG